MSGRSSALACAAFVWLALVSSAALVEPIVLGPDSSVVMFAPGTRYAIDSSLAATAEEQFRQIDTDLFQPLPHGNATFGFVDGAYWFHVGLLNRDSQVHRWILVLDYVLLDQIDVRVRRADGSVTQFASGDFHPFSARIALPIAEFPDRPC